MTKLYYTGLCEWVRRSEAEYLDVLISAIIVTNGNWKDFFAFPQVRQGKQFICVVIFKDSTWICIYYIVFQRVSWSWGKFTTCLIANDLVEIYNCLFEVFNTSQREINFNLVISWKGWKINYKEAEITRIKKKMKQPCAQSNSYSCCLKNAIFLVCPLLWKGIFHLLFIISVHKLSLWFYV